MEVVTAMGDVEESMKSMGQEVRELRLEKDLLEKQMWDLQKQNNRLRLTNRLLRSVSELQVKLLLRAINNIEEGACDE